MKKLLILALLLPLYSNAQDRADWAYVTPNKDTLYLEQNEPSADLNFKIWKSDTAWQGWNPVIVRAPREYIVYRRRTNVIGLK
jgi:hypothetical protein